MIAYISVYFIVIVNIIFKNIKSLKDIMFFLTFVVLFIFSGFIYETGPDWGVYEFLYNSNLKYFTEDMNEPFFILVSDIGKYFGFDKIFIQMVFTFFSLFFIYKTLKRINYHKFYMIFIYFCLTELYILNLVGIRQALAISIVFYAITIYLINDKKFSSFLFIFLAFMVHYSVIIILFIFPFLFLLRKYYNNYIYISLWVTSIILYKINFLSILTNMLIGRYEFYANVDNPESSFLRLIIHNLFFLFFLFFINRNKSKEFNFFLNYFFIGILILNIFASNVYLTRLWIYFEISLLFLITYSIFSQKINNIKYLLFISFSILLSILYIFIIVKYLSVYGYQNYLFLNL